MMKEGLMSKLFGTKEFAFVAVVVTVFFHQTCYAFDEGDWQYWNTESIEGNLTESIRTYMEAEFRFGDNVSKFYYQHTQLQLNFKINDWFILSPAFREVFELYNKSEAEDDWFAEHRSMLNGTVKWEWDDWKLSNRARVSYRVFDIDKDDVWRFRNKLIVKSPWKWTALEINPWLADEIFLEEYKDSIYRNRFYIGVGLKLIKHLKGDIFYLWQTTEKGNDWIDYNVFGTKLKLLF